MMSLAEKRDVSAKAKERNHGMAKILVAEDDAAVRDGIKALLEAEFNQVLVATDGDEALERYRAERPQLIVLDVMMPRRNGFEVCREIRITDTQTPILFLSAKGEEADKVLGLGLGADDYLAKPFGAHELLARVGALLRRAAPRRALPSNLPTVFRFGKFLVRGRELALIDARGHRIDISSREYALLQYFTAHPNEVLNRRELLDYVWGQGAFTYSRTIDTHICTLRRKIEKSGWCIETILGVGYRLRIPVSEG